MIGLIIYQDRRLVAHPPRRYDAVHLRVEVAVPKLEGRPGVWKKGFVRPSSKHRESEKGSCITFAVEKQGLLILRVIIVHDAVSEIGHALGRSFEMRAVGSHGTLDLIVYQNLGPRVLSDLEEGEWRVSCQVQLRCNITSSNHPWFADSESATMMSLHPASLTASSNSGPLPTGTAMFPLSQIA